MKKILNKILDRIFKRTDEDDVDYGAIDLKITATKVVTTTRKLTGKWSLVIDDQKPRAGVLINKRLYEH